MLVLAKQVRAACLLVLAECGRKAVLADLGHMCLRRPGLLGQASAGRKRPGQASHEVIARRGGVRLSPLLGGSGGWLGARLTLDSCR